MSRTLWYLFISQSQNWPRKKEISRDIYFTDKKESVNLSVYSVLRSLHENPSLRPANSHISLEARVNIEGINIPEPQDASAGTMRLYPTHHQSILLCFLLCCSSRPGSAVNPPRTARVVKSPKSLVLTIPTGGKIHWSSTTKKNHIVSLWSDPSTKSFLQEKKSSLIFSSIRNYGHGFAYAFRNGVTLYFSKLQEMAIAGVVMEVGYALFPREMDNLTTICEAILVNLSKGARKLYRLVTAPLQPLVKIIHNFLADAIPPEIRMTLDGSRIRRNDVDLRISNRQILRFFHEILLRPLFQDMVCFLLMEKLDFNGYWDIISGIFFSLLEFSKKSRSPLFPVMDYMRKNGLMLAYSPILARACTHIAGASSICGGFLIPLYERYGFFPTFGAHSAINLMGMLVVPRIVVKEDPRGATRILSKLAKNPRDETRFLWKLVCDIMDKLLNEP